MSSVQRLINQFVPENYNLSLVINRPERKFSGTVTITGQTTPNSRQVSLHARDLKIESINVNGKTAEFAIKDDEIVIAHPDILPDTKQVIDVSFSGKINDSMHGMYPCYYKLGGVDKELIATQFESHYARDVFPCIDEPGAKATFDVTLTTETGVTVLGNMPIKWQREENNSLVTSFQTTPRMSSYLLAWVYGELQKKSATTKSGVEVNIWATPAQPAASLDFALDIATRTIDFYNEYFDTPYPLPKSDHVALPDFSAGAMENWGLITYREVCLLDDPAITSVSGRQYIASVITHELSHQWFGNLVTMKWWNDLWLNESFAKLMESVSVDALEPSWQVWRDFITTESVLALRRDALDGIQPVQVEVQHPDDIDTIFDAAIVYAKGACLMHMLQTFVGDEAFRKGLQGYFKAHAYQNTEAHDLWKAIAEASGQPVDQLMTTWISQPGYPVVHAQANDGKIDLTQEQFFIGPHKPSTTLWPIPLLANTASAPALLDQKATSFKDNGDTLRLNMGGGSHFITNYDATLMKRLIGDLKAGRLDVVSRLQLINEQILLARSDVISSADLVTLIEAYADETEEPVWDMMALALAELRKFVEASPAAETKLRELSGNLAEKQFERLGWTEIDSEPESDTKLRAIIVSNMVYSERPDIIKQALDIFHQAPLEDLNPELRALLISNAVRNSGDPQLVDSLLKSHQATHSNDLQISIAAGLTSTKDPEVVTKLLDLLTDTSIIRAQDTMHWYVWLLRNRYGRNLTWQWLRDHWDWIVETFGGDNTYDDFVRYTAGSLVNQQQLDEFRDFFEPKQVDPALKRVIEVGLAELAGRVDLIERDSPAVIKRLTEASDV